MGDADSKYIERECYAQYLHPSKLKNEKVQI